MGFNCTWLGKIGENEQQEVMGTLHCCHTVIFDYSNSL